MTIRMGMLVVAVFAISATITLGQSGSAIAASGGVIPLQTELRVGAYVNISISSVSTSLAGPGALPFKYTASENETVISMNSSAYTISTELVENTTPSTLTFNSTGGFTPANSTFPYFNNANLYYFGGIYTPEGTYIFSNGTYDFNGQRLPMEKVVINNRPLGNFSVTHFVIEFDSYSGIMLNLTYQMIQNSSLASPGVLYSNGSNTLSATNMTMVNPAHGSSEGYLFTAVVVVIVAAVAAGGVFALRKRRRIR